MEGFYANMAFPYQLNIVIPNCHSQSSCINRPEL
jgi:hypothetical protein